jgi:predicted regulator of Ras-like GTPase activity (Roadblock/LC7/MglB family)
MSTGKIVEGDVSTRMTRLALAVEGALHERGMGGLKRLVIEGDSLSVMVGKVGGGVDTAFLCLVLPRDASVGLAQLGFDGILVDVKELLKGFESNRPTSGAPYRSGQP